ncbi:MAG: Lrp/AsnC family transcriptional regulator [Desulfobacula sp.]|uniref:Lrp/AsnC family transcriptional regulator n=1 Tax=Desulfobacula sp. TaxID=2593537 RepID=UPI001D95E229|nr:Lrp/AsnC family transcriptional regulator [Desulfobacula sp.]MBT3484933.1 Lrp/AsnC family transcriptional regulator [Desulfobacula sp.]MBT3803231.1 Lrp/AsnC family transcriptional regulator [Desulfobacula sp.]MBT4024614.1 Lrp/AsnC family transcriptional regulator [Desulfobacula sp.]MBT4197562.1 Lrp/AsnC family transcriptional regulator [Desulfobacula sp.]
MTLTDSNLDDLEIQIIKTLQIDARRSFKSIAKDLDVSEGTIGNRVNRLVKKNILKLEARVNPFGLTNKVAALFGVNLKTRSHTKIVKEIEKLPQVTSVWVTTGKYDLFLEVLVDSINDLNDFIFDGGLSKIENISFTETHIMLHSDTKYFKIP